MEYLVGIGIGLIIAALVVWLVALVNWLRAEHDPDA